MAERAASARGDPRFLGPLVVCALLLAAAPAGAQQRRIDRALYFGGQGLAWPRGALALGTNPAGLASATAFEVRARAAFGGAPVAGDRGAGWGTWLGLPFGPFALAASVEHAADPAPAVRERPAPGDLSRVSLGGGLRLDGWLDIGVAYRGHFGQAPQVGKLGTVDVGLQLSPWPWLALGARVSDLLGASSLALDEDSGALQGPHYAWGWAVKLREDALVWIFDLEWPGSEQIATMRGAALVRLGDAWRVGLEYLLFREPSASGVAASGHSRFGLTLSYRPSWWGVDVTVNRDRLPDQSGTGMMAVGMVLRHEPAFSAVDHVAALFGGRPLSGRGSPLDRHLRRRRLGWASPLRGEAARRAAAVARAVLGWNEAMTREDVKALCGALASGRVRFDIETRDPKLVIHRSFGREEACISLVRGELRAYLFEFGPSRVHREPSLLLPQLFRIHGSAYFRLPPVQERAYVDHLRRLRRGRKPLSCTVYRAHPLRIVPVEGAGASRALRVYEVGLLCEGLQSYVLQLEGDVAGGFKVRKMSLTR